MLAALKINRPTDLMPQRYETGRKSISGSQTTEFALIATAVIAAIGVVVVAAVQLYLAM